MKGVAISDTHLQHDFHIPEGDVLFHAGDGTFRGTIEEIGRYATWLKSIKESHGFQYVITIAGNHDWLFYNFPELARKMMEDNGIIYLEDRAITISKKGIPMVGNGIAPGPGNVVVYGSPWQPAFNNWAFNLKRGKELADKWAMIPEGVDVLLTHGPPKGFHDEVREQEESDGWSMYYGSDFRLVKKHVGCSDLRDRIQVVKPKFHIFGHIHVGYGDTTGPDGIRYINASICNEQYNPVNKPIEFEIGE